jgi:lipopolysaccharide/colanic/teichoic acid biosynthesis glycosyltransferase
MVLCGKLHGRVDRCREYSVKAAVRNRSGFFSLDRGVSAPGYHSQTDFMDRVPYGVRTFEILFASAVLLVTLPLIILIGLAIRIDSPGPALFWQTRVGRKRRPFRFVKFRTLFVDARRRHPELYAYQYDVDNMHHVCFKIKNDPRVTRVGRWLRKTSLDELPNFWCVLKGDMTLVGPRPEIPEMVRYYSERGMLRFDVRPGVTGLAEVNGRGHLTFREEERYDIDYALQRSFRLDLQILVRTIAVVLKGNGAY